MSNRFKKCPACGRPTPEGESYCIHCNQPVMDVEASVEELKEASNLPPEPTEGQKICPVCGTANDSYALLCSGAACGTDLRGKQPDLRFESSDSVLPKRLFLVVGEQEFECNDRDILGREGTVARELFAWIGTVSRRHVLLRRNENGWSAMVDDSVKNLAQLDGCEMSLGVAYPLTGEHVVKMSSRCEVKLRVSS